MKTGFLDNMAPNAQRAFIMTIVLSALAIGIYMFAVVPAQETLSEECLAPGIYALWEHASDQSIEPEDGMLGVAVVVPGAGESVVSPDGIHGICTREIRSGEPFLYKFGSCWSKGGPESAEAWFNMVREQL